VKNRIRELRSASGLSQEDLARQLGVSRQTVNAIENDKYDPMLPLAFRIAEVFGRRIEDVFQPSGRRR
jgi:putative transcriptional regulator